MIGLDGGNMTSVSGSFRDFGIFIDSDDFIHELVMSWSMNGERLTFLVKTTRDCSFYFNELEWWYFPNRVTTNDDQEIS